MIRTFKNFRHTIFIGLKRNIHTICEKYLITTQTSRTKWLCKWWTVSKQGFYHQDYKPVSTMWSVSWPSSPSIILSAFNVSRRRSVKILDTDFFVTWRMPRFGKLWLNHAVYVYKKQKNYCSNTFLREDALLLWRPITYIVIFKYVFSNIMCSIVKLATCKTRLKCYEVVWNVTR